VDRSSSILDASFLLQPLPLLLLHDDNHGPLGAALQLLELAAHISAEVPIRLLGSHVYQNILHGELDALLWRCTQGKVRGNLTVSDETLGLVITMIAGPSQL